MNQYLFNPNHYPFAAFPPLALKAFQQLVTNTQAPLPLIGSSLLSALAYAAQGRVRVRRALGLESPVSLYLLTISDSGERKSVVDGHTMRSIRALEAEAIKAFEQGGVARTVQEQTSRVKRDMLFSALRKSLRDGESTDHIEHDLAALEAQCSKPSQPPRLLFGDVTSEALLQSLHCGWSSAAVVASEGGLILEGHAMRRISVLNMLATGEPVTVDRKSSKSFALTDAKLSMSIMVQQKVLDQFRNKREDSARGSGMWTRFLFARPFSTQGGRFLTTSHFDWADVEAFNAQTRSMLECPNEPGRLLRREMRTLDFDVHAQHAWTDFYNAVECELAPWGFLADARDYGSRIAEQVARIAAIFHEFQEFAGPISVDTMLRAIDLGKWYLQEFVSIFGAGGGQDVVLEDCQNLYRYLNLMVARTGVWTTSKTSVRQRGPLRDGARLQQALDLMTSQGLLRVATYGRTHWVELNHLMFGGPIQAAAAQFRLTPPAPALPFSPCIQPGGYAG